MKEKYLVLKLVNATDQQFDFVRTTLINETYVEMDSQFTVSCSATYRNGLRTKLNRENIAYVLIYVNIKSGCDVISNGIDNEVFKQIKNIVLDKS